MTSYQVGRVVRPIVLYNSTGKTITCHVEKDATGWLVLTVERAGRADLVLPNLGSLAYAFSVDIGPEERVKGLRTEIRLRIVAHVTVAVYPSAGPVPVYYIYTADGREEVGPRVFRVLEDEPLAMVNFCPPGTRNSVLLNRFGATVSYTTPFVVRPEILQTRLVLGGSHND